MKRFLRIAAVVYVLAMLAATVYAEDGAAQNDEKIALTPKVLVQSYECVSLEEDAEDGVVTAGDTVKVRVTLVNTSWTEAVMNMTVTATAMNENFILQSESDCQYIRYIYAGSTIDIFYEYEIKAETPAGQYGIQLTYDYAYGNGMSYSGSGTARVTVAQPLEMEFSLSPIPNEVVLSDTIAVNIQAINLSRTKAYNVRAEIEADGFAPAGTAFIGDIEGGVSMPATVQVSIVSLTKSNFPYGKTKGTVTYYYEDADGNEFSETKEFTTEIKSPFSTSISDTEDEPEQWWIIMAVIAAVILMFTSWFVIRRIRGRKNDETVE